MDVQAGSETSQAGRLLAAFLTSSCSARFLTQPRTGCPGRAQWAGPTCTDRGIETVSQTRSKVYVIWAVLQLRFHLYSRLLYQVDNKKQLGQVRYRQMQCHLWPQLMLEQNGERVSNFTHAHIRVHTQPDASTCICVHVCTHILTVKFLLSLDGFCSGLSTMRCV